MLAFQEKLSVLDFVDTSDSTGEPEKPLPLEITPFKLVEEVKDLKQLAIKLRGVNEFAVKFDLCVLCINTIIAFYFYYQFIVFICKLSEHIGVKSLV